MEHPPEATSEGGWGFCNTRPSCLDNTTPSDWPPLAAHLTPFLLPTVQRDGQTCSICKCPMEAGNTSSPHVPKELDGVLIRLRLLCTMGLGLCCIGEQLSTVTPRLRADEERQGSF